MYSISAVLSYDLFLVTKSCTFKSVNKSVHVYLFFISSENNLCLFYTYHSPVKEQYEFLYLLFILQSIQM